MTLVAGFSGSGGLALFADSQETKQGYGKKSVDKLEFWTEGPSGFAFCGGGAGSAVHIDKLMPEIGAIISGHARSHDDMNTMVEHLEVHVSEFFKSHIWSRGNDKPELELLIALQPKGGRAELFHVAEGLVAYVPAQFKAIGVGSYLAEFLIDKLQDFG